MPETPNADLPQNAAGEPEFASLILTIDHLTLRPGRHIHQKLVLSTQTAIAALSALADYYGQHDQVKHSEDFLEIVAASGRASDPVFVYTTPENVQIITSTPTWDGLVQSPAFGRTSSLVASQKLLELVAKVSAEAAERNRGGIPRLFMFELSPTDPDAGSEEAREQARQDIAGGGEDDRSTQQRETA
jgi:hypothetical protein